MGDKSESLRLVVFGPDHVENSPHLGIRIDADGLQVSIKGAALVIAGISVSHKEIIDDAGSYRRILVTA